MSISSEVLTERESELLQLFPEEDPLVKWSRTSVELARALYSYAEANKGALSSEVVANWKKAQQGVMGHPDWEVFLEKEEVSPGLYLFKEKTPGFFEELDGIYAKAKGK